MLGMAETCWAWMAEMHNSARCMALRTGHAFNLRAVPALSHMEYQPRGQLGTRARAW